MEEQGVTSRKTWALSQEELAAVQARHIAALDMLDLMVGYDRAYALITEYTLEAIERGIAKGKRELLQMLRHEGRWS